MRKNVYLITNNPCFQQTVGSSRLVLLNGTSLDALIAARDAVHMGDVLLTHPLYGNLRPNQQPFRSILLRRPAREERNFAAADYMESVSKIEEAVLLYQSYGSRLIAPGIMPDAVRSDYSFVDSELMRESLAQYGLISK